MNAISAGEGPYSIQVYQQIPDENGVIIDILIGTLSENGVTYFDDLTAGNYLLIGYDTNGCCGQTLVSMNEPGSNSLSVLEYEGVACPGFTTEVNFMINGAVGQFDVFGEVELIYLGSAT